MEIKTIEDVKNSNLFGNSNYDLLMQESMQVLAQNQSEFSGRNMDVGDTPISPVSMNDDCTPILLSEEVMNEYNRLVSLINNPSTAKEYSFVLLGKLGSLAGEPCYLVDKIINCDSISNANNLSNRETKIDEAKLNGAIQYGMTNGYNLISLGHTHPIISEEEKRSTLASYLSEEVRDSSFIREPGLNLSLQDFVSYESLYQYFVNRPNIRTCQTVIMFNGEMAMFSKNNNDIQRFSVIMDRTTGEPIYVSSKEDIKENHRTL